MLRLRAPLEKYEWVGDWSENSPKWTPELRKELATLIEDDPADEVDENEFWMSYEDMLSRFANLNVCKAVNMEEMRVRGKFLRIQDVETPSIEMVMSKWYYSIDLEETTKMFIGLHQEDERKIGVRARRPYLDVSIVVMKRMHGGLVLVDLKDL